MNRDKHNLKRLRVIEERLSKLFEDMLSDLSENDQDAIRVFISEYIMGYMGTRWGITT